MRPHVFALLIALLMLGGVILIAQEDGPLMAEEVALSSQTDAFGQTVQVATGRLSNFSDMAYENISIFADLLDADGEVIGEGFGVLVDACGTGLLPEFALQPGRSQPFSLGLEFFGEATQVDSIEFFPEGREVAPQPEEELDLEHLRVVDRREVVNVEWIDSNNFRFAVGCDDDVFTRHDWFRYEITSDSMARIIHPNREQVTDALLTQLGLDTPAKLNHSFLTFAPTSRRIVYQTDINVMLTAEPDGSFKRLIYENLSRFSLQGYVWLPEGRFMAYYYGAYGDPVRYFTASVDGQLISANIDTITPSFTVPGPTADGGRLIITTTRDNVTGYYLSQSVSQNAELLFAANPPGNNWPAPVYVAGAAFGEADIYIARPVDGEARLQCFDLETRTLTDLTALPLNLSTEDRAWMSLSPDGNTLVLTANGQNGGLWLVGIASLGRCSGIST